MSRQPRAAHRVGILALLAAATLSALAPAAQAAPASTAGGPAVAAPQVTLPRAPGSRINGSGSSWAANALFQWVGDIKAQGLTVDYNPNGSSSGRKEFVSGMTDFTVSEIPYTGRTADPSDGGVVPPMKYGMLPAVAGGTAFMYNLPVGGQQLKELNLDQPTLAKIFTGQITMWDDPAIKATNGSALLPHQRITVVVRSDGSGASAQFTNYLQRQFPGDYARLCSIAKCNPSTPTSYFPKQGLANFVGQAQSIGVTNYVATTPYSINYDEYSYALNAGLHVASVKNAAGFFVQPTAQAVAVALTQADINTQAGSPEYLTQDLGKVYPYKDPRAYPLSAYSYFITPQATNGKFDADKGASLGFFLNYALCGGQQSMAALGYSPLPMNLVLAAQQQILKIPGVDPQTSAAIAATAKSVKLGSGNPCNNPTFQPGDSPSVNQLVRTAPFPAACDAACQRPWTGIAAQVNNGPKVAGAKTAAPNARPAAPQAAAPGAPGAAVPGTTTPGAVRAGVPTRPGAVRPGTTAAAPGAPGAAAAQACNPETGAGCAPAGDVAAVAAGAAGAPVQTVLAADTGWGGSQNILVVVGLCLALLVLGPPLAMAALRRGRDGGAAS